MRTLMPSNAASSARLPWCAAALVRGYPLAQRCARQFTQGRASDTRR
jgi:hypothetical protein